MTCGYVEKNPNKKWNIFSIQKCVFDARTCRLNLEEFWSPWLRMPPTGWRFEDNVKLFKELHSLDSALHIHLELMEKELR